MGSSSVLEVSKLSDSLLNRSGRNATTALINAGFGSDFKDAVSHQVHNSVREESRQENQAVTNSERTGHKNEHEKRAESTRESGKVSELDEKKGAELKRNDSPEDTRASRAEDDMESGKENHATSESTDEENVTDVKANTGEGVAASDAPEDTTIYAEVSLDVMNTREHTNDVADSTLKRSGDPVTLENNASLDEVEHPRGSIDGLSVEQNDTELLDTAQRAGDGVSAIRSVVGSGKHVLDDVNGGAAQRSTVSMTNDTTLVTPMARQQVASPFSVTGSVQSIDTPTVELKDTVISAARQSSYDPLLSQSPQASIKVDKMLMAATSLENSVSSVDATQAKTTTLTGISNVMAASNTLSPAQSTRMQMPVSISFGKPEWAGMVAERTAMMAAQNINTAELRLDPPELGPLQVKVSINQDQASVSFHVANTGVREALDQTALRLRELMEQQGLDLVDVDVSDRSLERHEHSHDDAEGRDGHADEELAATLESESEALSTTVSYGVDYFV